MYLQEFNFKKENITFECIFFFKERINKKFILTNKNKIYFNEREIRQLPNIKERIENVTLEKNIYMKNNELLTLVTKNLHFENKENELFFNENDDILDVYIHISLMKKKYIYKIGIADLCFTTELKKIFQYILPCFLNKETIYIIKKCYCLISKHYNYKLYLYPGFILNQLIIDLTKRYLLSGHKNFLTYKDEIIITSNNKQKLNSTFLELQQKFNNFGIYFDENNSSLIDINKDNLIFNNNLVLENKRKEFSYNIFHFLKYQLKNNIEQTVPLSKECLLKSMEYLNNLEFNILKNNIENNKLAYLLRFKEIYDGCYS